MKKMLVLLCLIVFIFSLNACSGKQTSIQNSEGTQTSFENPETTVNFNNQYSGREMYEEIIVAFIEIDDELSRGWFDEGAQRFVKLIKGDNVPADASAVDLMKIYRSFDDTIEYTEYSIRDFFTVTDYDESTNGGVYNFFEAIDQLEDVKLNGKDVVKIDSNGNVIGFDFDIAGGDDVIADALSVSPEFVKIMLCAASDAGFSVVLKVNK